MAAGRFNIPTILVICGYQSCGEMNGKSVDIEDVFLGSVQASFGKLTREEVCVMAENAIRGPGVCQGMATANSMHVVCEALGMSLPGSAPVLANGPKMKEFARLWPAHRRPGARRHQAQRYLDHWRVSQCRGSRACSQWLY